MADHNPADIAEVMTEIIEMTPARNILLLLFELTTEQYDAVRDLLTETVDDESGLRHEYFQHCPVVRQSDVPATELARLHAEPHQHKGVRFYGSEAAFVDYHVPIMHPVPSDILAVTIESRPDKLGFRLRCRNATDVPITVTLPHPRERVWFYKNGVARYPDALPMVWETERPRRLEPDGELVADICIYPYWLDYHGEFRIDCDVSYGSDEIQDHTVRATGVIEVDLPNREQMKRNTQAAIEKYGAENIPVQREIVILDEKTVS